MTKELALYESARAALAKAVKVDEVKDIRDKAMAMKTYAKRAKDRELEADAFELRARAERRLGQMLEEGKADRAQQGGDRAKVSEKRLPTLKEIGVDGNLAHRARSAAAMTEEAFNEMVSEMRENVLHPLFEERNPYPLTEEQKEEQREERRKRRAEQKKRMKKHRTTLERHDARIDAEAEITKKQNPIPPEALWLWGRLRDFERDMLHLDLNVVMTAMTPEMHDEAAAFAPKVAAWLSKI
jgi:hypothetical protein